MIDPRPAALDRDVAIQLASAARQTAHADCGNMKMI